MRAALVALALLLGVAAAPAPSERLADPAAEARARALFKEVRCVVCQNESIDESDADLAADLRRLVREEVAAGRTDAEIMDGLNARYGEFIRMRPLWSAQNLLLWLGPLAVVALGAAGLMGVLRARPAAEPALSPEEERRLREVLNPPRSAQ